MHVKFGQDGFGSSLVTALGQKKKKKKKMAHDGS